MYCLNKFSSGCHPLTQGMPRVRSSLHTIVQSSTHSLLLQIQWYFVMWNEKDQSLCSACVYAKEVMGNPVATRASLSSPCLRGKLAWVLLTAVVQASHSHPVTPAVLQPAKMACLLCIETQDRGAQSVVLIAYSQECPSVWSFLSSEVRSQEHMTCPDCLFSPFLPNYVCILTALESFYQFPVKIVQHVHIFWCVCWGRWASCPLTLPYWLIPFGSFFY